MTDDKYRAIRAQAGMFRFVGGTFGVLGVLACFAAAIVYLGAPPYPQGSSEIVVAIVAIVVPLLAGLLIALANYTVARLLLLFVDLDRSVQNIERNTRPMRHDNVEDVEEEESLGTKLRREAMIREEEDER